MIDTNRLLSLFEKLISFDSPSFSERKIGDFVTQQLHKLGVSVWEDGAAEEIGGQCGNLLGFLEGDLTLPPLLLCAHLDTVKPSHNKQMQISKAGVITSAGETVLGADDCAGIASILEALTALKASGLPHRPIELLFTVAEEPYCRGVQALDLSRIRSGEAYVFDLAGPVGTAAYQAPTILSFTSVFTGRSAHAGFAPEQGIHAIGVAARAVAAIPCGRIDGNTTLNIGTIIGGTANNVVPNCCTLTGEIRSYSGTAAMKLLADITQTMQKIAKEHGAKADISYSVHVAAYRTDPESAVAKRFKTVCSELGLPGHLVPTFGGSDNNYLTQKGIQGIVVATAMNNCHSTREYTTIAELEHAARLALALMLSKE
ncbi:MAG: M20/M25/M40 family metallo-hydrolase [Oscillospiraceae bacterium]|nr:M20/M25/M40 family metallo-hydrolase [Oscillospiraceae bacterium]